MKTPSLKYFSRKPYFFVMGLALFFFSCHGGDKAAGGDDEDAKVVSQTPVTVTTVNDSTLVDYIDLNATSTTLQKNYVKSNANGYIEQVDAQLGQNVGKGQLLFIVKTKEAQTIGNSINVLDTTFKPQHYNKLNISIPLPRGAPPPTGIPILLKYSKAAAEEVQIDPDFSLKDFDLMVRSRYSIPGFPEVLVMYWSNSKRSAFFPFSQEQVKISHIHSLEGNDVKELLKKEGRSVSGGINDYNHSDYSKNITEFISPGTCVEVFDISGPLLPVCRRSMVGWRQIIEANPKWSVRKFERFWGQRLQMPRDGKQCGTVQDLLDTLWQEAEKSDHIFYF